ncbi:3-hydroxyacyl-CoA dehydrogenase family protein [Novipirellula caenicola]|uniref:Fatty acid oxidation complex subunit alpha n=1 Tax=Novipirellula caenicola TaxID=1536901 RepID=A0ABP9VKC8_9BACT
MSRPDTLLVGLGVVGRAIAKVHLAANVSITIGDVDAEALESCVEELDLDPSVWQIASPRSDIEGITMIDLSHRDFVTSDARPILIESIVERLQVKQQFFQRVERCLGKDWILCSNTSTLRIGDIAGSLNDPSRLIGMHFFMPVTLRDAVEVIPTADTSAVNLAAVTEHVRRIDRSPLVVADSPGFIVNRMLSPYLNEAMLLLSQGATAEQIEQAALRFGMPLSPLELIDLIGSRTMFDAGRVYWQSFPTRIDPSPMLPAMIKKGRGGRFSGGGFYDYVDGVRSTTLAAAAMEIRDRYSRNTRVFGDDEVLDRLRLAMWIESALLLREGVAQTLEQVEIAMAGGLGYRPRGEWYASFDRIGSDVICRSIAAAAADSKSLQPPAELLELLSDHTPSESIVRFARGG